MEKGGNKKANEEWEYHLPSSFKKLPSSSPAIEHFIRDKYVGRRLFSLASVCSLTQTTTVAVFTLTLRIDAIQMMQRVLNCVSVHSFSPPRP